MGRRLRVARLLALGSLVGLLPLLFSGCDAFSSPQNTFAPGGTVAQQQKDDFLLVMWPALVIGVGVMVGLLYICLRYRRKTGDAFPKQVHGNTPLELTWTILPALLLAVMAVPTVAGIRDLARDPRPGSLQVNVTGQRFTWQFDYPDIDSGGAPLQSISELHIVVGQEVAVHLKSIDVNHSFWVPKLAGKTDVINNHPNHMWLKATKPGVYEGQCAEFCGLDHAQMRFRVIAQTQDEFDQWVASQQAAARAAQGQAEQAVAAGD